MTLSQKCQYGLRAIFELSKRTGQGAISISEIAEAQAIPTRFLELILSELKQAGFVKSRRGVQGGYMLAVSPHRLTVGEIIRFFEGPLSPVKCIAKRGGEDCPLWNRCAFLGLWERAEKAVSEVYDSTSFQDLIAEEAARRGQYVPSYCI